MFRFLLILIMALYILSCQPIECIFEHNRMFVWRGFLEIHLKQDISNLPVQIFIST